MKNKIFVIFGIAIILITILIAYLIKSNKTIKSGNNKSIKEIEDYILNIEKYNAKISVKIKSNKNENEYTITQSVYGTDNEKQITYSPNEIKGMEIIYKDGKLEIKNAQLNMSKIYENYPYITNNNLFLTSFIDKYKNVIDKQIKELKNNEVEMSLEYGKKYDYTEKLYVNKKTLKPTKLEIIDANNNTKIYISYSEIEINN